MTARLMPLEAERAVLGCVLSAASLGVDAGHRVLRRVQAAGLDPEHFSLASHAELYRTIQHLVDQRVPVDAVSVGAELDRDHADPWLIGRLSTLAHEVPAIGAAERYARIVMEAALRREIEERAAGGPVI